ncbi:MAG: alpha/beta hydrolase fold domain-containing protein [Clostridia bacterium]|nr:alpha/beta hydrolase fold domain-containing protein [Clostridia bacterium]
MKKKRAFIKIGFALFWLCLIVCTFIAVGTLLFFIPFVGDVASIAFLPVYPILAFLVLLCAAASVFLLIKRKNKRSIAAFCLAATNVIVMIVLSAVILSTVNAQGEKISFFKAFVPYSADGVLVEEGVYVDQKNDNIPISIYYQDDGKTNKPVIFYTHGGGWIQGARTDRLQTTQSFAQNGYVVMCPDYDLSNDEEHLYDVTEEQLLHALAYCENTVSDFGGNMEKLYMVGDSAGGNLALELAYKINSGIYHMPHAVKAVSVIYPVTDIKDFYYSTNMLTSSAAKKMAVSYLGALPEEESERYESLNPTRYIDKNTPSTLIVHGKADSSVPIESSERFFQALADKGITAKLIRVPFANHATDTNANNFLAQTYIGNTLSWFAENQ